jgi:serine/threonine protein kinase
MGVTLCHFPPLPGRFGPRAPKRRPTVQSRKSSQVLAPPPPGLTRSPAPEACRHPPAPPPAMSRRGECPACSARYDASAHAPMVSVVCGHSVCARCVDDLAPTGARARGGSESDDEVVCPTCSVPLVGFVKNFEALHALQTVAEAGGGGSASASGSGSAGGGDVRRNKSGSAGSVVSTGISPPRVDRPTPLPYPEIEDDEDLVGEDGDGDVGERRSTFASSASGRGVMAGSVSTRSVRPLEADVSNRMHVIERADLHFERSPANELGSGSSGVVYAGTYGPDGRRVAIKCVRAASRDAADSDKFRRELQLISRLRDENIVAFVGAAWDEEDDAGQDRPPTILLVTELMRGGTLRSALSGLPNSGVGGLEVHSFLAIATNIARGLVYLHAEGYAHRDIKSANILLTDAVVPGSNAFPASVRAKIADFGLSKSIDKLTGGGVYQPSVMEPGRLEATYAYLAPEAFGGDKTNVTRAEDDDDARLQETAKKRDIYALGVLFWEMITGRVPWAGTSLPDVYVRVCVRSDRPTPSLEDSKVPKTLRRLVERCWNQDAKKRPSASSIVDKLERITARLHKVPDVGPTVAAAVAVAVAAAAAGAVTTSGGEPTSASYWSSTTPKAVIDEAARRKVEDDASATSRRRAPALVREQNDELYASAPGKQQPPLQRQQQQQQQQQQSHQAGRNTPVSRAPRDAARHTAPAAAPAVDDWLSASAPVTVIPQHLQQQHQQRLAPHATPVRDQAAKVPLPSALATPSSRDFPRSSSGAVLGSSRSRLKDRVNDGGIGAAQAGAGASAAASAAAAALAGTGRRSSDPKDPALRPRFNSQTRESIFSRSPSYGGPVTTSGALTGGGPGHEPSVLRGSRPPPAQRRLLSMEAARENGPVSEGREGFAGDADLDADDADFGLATEVAGGDDLLDETADAMVADLSTAELLSLLSQRSQPMRLAALALAALESPAHAADEEVLRAACALLHRLTVPAGYGGADGKSVTAMEQLTIRKFLKSNGGVDALLRVLKRPETRHPTTLSYSLLALGNVTAWDLDAHKQFRNSSGVAHISDCMRHHAGNPGVEEKGSYAIACAAAAYPPRSKSVFLETGCIDFVVAALDASSQRKQLGDAVSKQACAALGAMCAGCPENAAHAASGGAIAHLVAAFDCFRNSPRADGGRRNEMHLVGTAFMNLMCHPESRRYASSHGGTSLMLRSMRIFRLDADFVEKCLSTLSEFCTFRANASQIVQMSGVDDIIAAMIRFKTSVPVQRAGCRTLSALMKATGDQARRRVVHASGSEAIVFALERFGATTGVHAAVAVEGCRAIGALCAMESVEEGEILSRRMKKIRTDRALKQTMQAHRGNHAVEEKGREALKNLGNLRPGGWFFSRMRGKKA